MDFSKLTKQELLEKVIEQQALSDAINQKDKELSELKKQISELRQRPSREELDVTKRKLQEETENLRKRLSEFDGALKKEDIEKYTKTLEEEVKKSRDIANQYIRAHRDLLRIFKVNLDFAISHDELLSEKLK